MRLVFLGSPAAAHEPLRALIEDAATHGHELVGVVSQPARPVGRERQPVDPPVAAFARARGLRVLQPESAKDPAFLEAFAALQPDVAITAAYGQILSDAFLAVPRRATINIHPSLLPKYRGATPVPAALLAGETETGVTILFTVKKLDAGNVIVQERFDVGPQETAGELTKRGFDVGARLLWPALAKLEDPAFAGTPQDERRVTHCTKIDKHDGLVDWNASAEEIHNRFRAFEPWPGTFTFHDGRRVVVVEMRADTQSRSALAPGEAVLDKKNQSLQVGTGEGTLHLTKLKPAGGKVVAAPAFWNGLKDRSRVVFARHE
jgi:methionyl-tRNA formyltransferase